MCLLKDGSEASKAVWGESSGIEPKEPGMMNRRQGPRAAMGRASLGLMLVAGACAQAPGIPATPPHGGEAAAALPGAAADPEDEVLRQIEDPSTGDRWLLLRNRDRPGGPGRLVLARPLNSRESGRLAAPAQSVSAGERLVIRSGDALTVEEHTAAADVNLQAVALQSAARGTPFRARLEIGGKVVQVVAISPGRADFAPGSGVEP